MTTPFHLNKGLQGNVKSIAIFFNWNCLKTSRHVAKHNRRFSAIIIYTVRAKPKLW